jgi:hypothetical protein
MFVSRQLALIIAIIVTILVVSAVAAGAARLVPPNPVLTEQAVTNAQSPNEDANSYNNQDSENNSVETGTTQQEEIANATNNNGTFEPQEPTGPAETITTLYVVPEPPFAIAILSIFAAAAAFLVHKKNRQQNKLQRH